MKTNLDCVYKIVNTINEDIYIGSTKYFSRRRSEHLYKLKKCIHPNKKLQELFNLNNNCFTFIVLETNCESLKDREQYYIDLYKPILNVCEKAISSIGFKHSVEAINKMKVDRKGKQNSLGRILSDESKEKMRNKALERHRLNRINKL